MTYVQDLEQKLREWLDGFAEGDVSKDQFIAFLKQSQPESHRNGRKRARVRRRKAIAKAFIIVYQVLRERREIEIIAVFHGKQDRQ
jgi:hypothetical protein